MQTHSKAESPTPTLLRFLKRRGPRKKAPIELRPIKRKSKQIKLKPSIRSKPSRASPSSSPSIQHSTLPRSYSKRSLPLPEDLSPYLAPPTLTSRDIDTHSPEFRVSHVRYFNKLKKDSFPMLDKTMYYEANKASLGMKLRRFRQFFTGYDEDVQALPWVFSLVPPPQFDPTNKKNSLRDSPGPTTKRCPTNPISNCGGD